MSGSLNRCDTGFSNDIKELVLQTIPERRIEAQGLFTVLQTDL
jgi:hypothetical protein